MDILWQSSFKSLQVDLHTIRSEWPLSGRWENPATICSDCMQMYVKTCKHTSLVVLRKVILRRLHKCLNTNNIELMNICVCFGEYRTKLNVCICVYIPAYMHTHCMHELVQVSVHIHTCEYTCAHSTCMCACVNVCVCVCEFRGYWLWTGTFLKSQHRPLLRHQFKELFSTQKKALRREKRRAEKRNRF